MKISKNHREKMSVHVNVHMSKIMHISIKVGVHTLNPANAKIFNRICGIEPFSTKFNPVSISSLFGV